MKARTRCAFTCLNCVHGQTGTEQTPKDNYQFGIFDPSFFTAANCPIGLTSVPSGKGTYCQLMGKYKLELNGYRMRS